MERREPILVRVLRRGEDLGLFVSFLLLILVEAGYVAWLERLPAFPIPDPPDGFLSLPPWYGRPRVEVTLLLTLLGGLIAWTGMGLLAFMRNKRRSTATCDAHRTAVMQRLKTTAFYAVLTGADLLLIQFLRS